MLFRSLDLILSRGSRDSIKYETRFIYSNFGEMGNVGRENHRRGNKRRKIIINYDTISLTLVPTNQWYR